MLKRNLAAAGAFFTGIPNAMLSMIFFMIAVGSLDFYFPHVGEMMLLTMALMLGIGFVLGEAIANIIQVERGGILGAGIAAAAVVLLCVYVNIGAGNYRAKDFERESADAAKIAASQDPRWAGLQSDRAAQQGMLANGYLPDDAEANAQLDIISERENAIIAEYVKNSHVNKMEKADVSGIDWMIDTVFGNRKVFTFALLAINLIFGLCVQTWYKSDMDKSKNPTKTKREETKTTSTPRQEIKEPKQQHISEPAIAHHKNPVGFGSDKVQSLPEKKTQTGSITFSNQNKSDRDYEEMNRKSRESANKKKEMRKRLLKKYLESNPNASLAEMASAIGVSSGQTVRKYLDEIGYAPQYAKQGAKFSAT